MTASPERWPSAAILRITTAQRSRATDLKVLGFMKTAVEKEKEDKHFINPTEVKRQFSDWFAIFANLQGTPEITEEEVSEQVSALLKGTPAMI